MTSFSFQRFFVYFKKENKQILRDPSTILIAFILPLLMIFIFGYGVSFDTTKMRVGIVIEDTANEARSLVNSFVGSPYFETKIGYNYRKFEENMILGYLHAVITIPQDFSKNLQRGTPLSLQVILDGSHPTVAKFIHSYTRGVIANWAIARSIEYKEPSLLLVNPEPRFWFNSKLRSRDVIMPGSLAIIISLIGTLLTAIVVAREWERGTMEDIMVTPIQPSEMLLGKLVPYFFLGLGSMALCVLVAIILFHVPFRGSFFVLFLSTSAFLLPSLAQGLLISSTTRDQFVACQVSIMLGFLPGLLLSDVVFDISSMPWLIQVIAYAFPHRYFVINLENGFLVSGTSWNLILPNIFFMLLIAFFLLGLTRYKMRKKLD